MTHGLSQNPLYHVWDSMIKRCYNHKDKYYHLYGGNGVIVCDEWRNDVAEFIKWGENNGYKKGLQLDKDKIPKSKGEEGLIYSPNNCCFLSPKENSNYRKDNLVIKYNGEDVPFRIACERAKITNPNTVYLRIYRYNISFDEAANPNFYKQKPSGENHHKIKKNIANYLKAKDMIRMGDSIRKTYRETGIDRDTIRKIKKEFEC